MKKLSLGILAVIIITALLSMSVTAAPYAEIKIGDGVSTIIATDFDSGEYEWTDNGGGKDIRPDEAVGTEVGESEFGSDVGWTDQGTGIQWTVQVEFDGKYKFEVWLASDNASNEGMSLLYNGAKIGESGPATVEGWQVYTLYTIGEIEMSAGTQVIKGDWSAVGGFNVSAIIVTCLEKATPPVVEEEVAAPAEVAPAEVAPVVVAAPVVAAQTSDAGVYFAAIALISLAAVVVVSKKIKE
jgi:hypothetical protein